MNLAGILINFSRILPLLLLQILVHLVSQRILPMVSSMLQIVLPLLSQLLRKRGLKKKTHLAQQVLHLLRALLPFLLRKFRCLYLFHRLKKKDQDHIEKIRETFSQVKINIPLLDAI